MICGVSSFGVFSDPHTEEVGKYDGPPYNVVLDGMLVLVTVIDLSKQSDCDWFF